MITYLTDSKSILKMDAFLDLNMSSQNLKEDLKNWVGGELYIQKSLYDTIRSLPNYNIIKIDESYDIDILEKSDIIICPGWKNIDSSWERYSRKMYSYYYFESQYPNFKNKTINPWRYNNKNFCIPITPIKIPQSNFNKEYNIKGLLIGKCISHVVSKNKQEKLLSLINNLETNLFTTLRPLNNFEILPKYILPCQDKCLDTLKKIFDNQKIYNLGILNVLDFRSLLLGIKYAIFYCGAFAPPTIIECLQSECLILATSNVIPKDLLDNQNIYLIDNLTYKEINNLIFKIESGEIKFKKEHYPSFYTEKNKINMINNLVYHHLKNN